ncbi:lysophosphatidylcholine acyltransferase 2-like [Sycon ciliatum]|uniref:lysophosphatidylcholine acyltransferase 2-like n=1 Tax=Sycon ciliatum TaxID=27933 RepID=UPI0031F67327
MAAEQYSATRGLSVRRLPEPKENPFCFRLQWTPLRCLQVAFGALVILPIRLTLVLLLVLPVTILCKLVAVTMPTSAEGIKYHLPWQRLLVKVALSNICGRLMLWSFGFPWLRTIGKQASFDEAPIVVGSPHTSIFDAFVLGYHVAGSYVSLESNRKYLLLGDLLTATETIWVNEKNTEDSVAEFRKRLKSDRQSSPIVFFPEGTVHGPGVLTEFKLGAFKYGLPVQPVFLHFDTEPGWIFWSYYRSIPAALLQTMSILYNPITLQFLPVYKPSEAEKQDPQLYARNFQRTIAEQMDHEVSLHSRQDMHLTGFAVDYGLPAWVGNVEYVLMRDTFRLNLNQLKILLKRFAALDSDKDGFITCEDFTADLKWPAREGVSEFFRICDTASRGKITFREYAIAYADLMRPFENDSAFVDEAFETLTVAATQVSKSVKDAQLSVYRTWLKESAADEEVLSSDDFKQLVSKKPELLVLVSLLSALSKKKS